MLSKESALLLLFLICNRGFTYKMHLKAIITSLRMFSLVNNIKYVLLRFNLIFFVEIILNVLMLYLIKMKL